MHSHPLTAGMGAVPGVAWKKPSKLLITLGDSPGVLFLSLSCSETLKAEKLPVSLGEWKDNQAVNVNEGDIRLVSRDFLGSQPWKEWRIPESTVLNLAD